MMASSENNNDESNNNITRKNYLLKFLEWGWYRTRVIWCDQIFGGCCCCSSSGNNSSDSNEISGSMGDLGTLIPLMVAMARQRSILLAPSLFWAGVTNIITGYLWDVPMCVQPMKSIAAVALSEGLSQNEVSAAGIWMGAFMVILGITQLIEVVNAIIPPSVVSGLQIGVGLRLTTKGINMVSSLDVWYENGKFDCIALAVVVAILCMYWLREESETRQITANTDNKHDIIAKKGGSLFNNEDDERKAENIYQKEDAENGCINDSSLVGSTLAYNESSCDDEKSLQQTEQINNVEMKSIFHGRFCASNNRKKQHPVGIYLFVLGCILATITLSTNPTGKLGFFGAPVAQWIVSALTRNDFYVGLLQGALPQLPLTTLNSVISVCCLAHTLYPEKRIKRKKEVSDNKTDGTIITSNENDDDHSSSDDAVLSRREVCISVGLMNLLLVPLGSMPNCHGAGGLAGQHRMGARHGGSVVFLGTLKVLLAVFFGASALTLLDAFPQSVLGVMLVIAGQELTTTGVTFIVKQQGRNTMSLRQNVVIAIVTAMVIVGLGKTHYGALSGWVMYMVYGDGSIQFKQWLGTKLCRYFKKKKINEEE